MPVTKENNRVLGILIRSNRIRKGYSLRELGQRANISHTLISNIEKGQLIPSNETLRDLFKELDLKFYDDIELHREFMRKSKQIYTRIFNYDYAEAGILLEKLRKFEEKLMFSIDVVDYVLVKGFYYASVQVKLKEINDAFDKSLQINLRQLITFGFSEKYLLYKIIERTYGRKYFKFDS